MNLRAISQVLIGTCLLVAPALAQAQASDFYIPDFVGTASPTGTGLIDTIINIVNALLVLAAIAAIVFIIISGVRYFASQGDEAAVDQAKRTLIYGIVGIIIILLAAVIVNFFAVNIG